MSDKLSSKRMVANAVLDNIKRTQAALTDKKCQRHGCFTSWHKSEDMANTLGVTGITFTKEDAKRRDEALAGYDRDILELEHELNKWYEALGHALDSLEGRV